MEAISIYKQLIVKKCEFCGIGIAKKPFKVKINNQEAIFCSEDCYKIYERYEKIKASTKERF